MKSLDRLENALDHLNQAFKGCRVVNITTARIKRYIETRREEKAENGTINRELAALKRMFSLAAESTPPKVALVPHIPMLEENHVRKGFFEHGDFMALREKLPAHL
jgi:hypothetical protein